MSAQDRVEWLFFWCVVRALLTGERQRIYHNKIGGKWVYWSTAASAGYGLDDDAPERERARIEQYRREKEQGR